ncbi:hypothetical protein [Streptomyces sp. NPDC000656]|uniref:hypothetical protein n=1 Tax=unclassified Streptomyces TaxID=2593676 RepID=UPI003680DD16
MAEPLHDAHAHAHAHVDVDVDVDVGVGGDPDRTFAQSAPAPSNPTGSSTPRSSLSGGQGCLRISGSGG